MKNLMVDILTSVIVGLLASVGAAGGCYLVALSLP